jgi:glutathione synthase/RimK-type ligase-like ATP-grasp enzyme
VSSTATVAFVTYSGVPDLTVDDRLAVDALAMLDVRTDALCWDDPSVEWQRYDAIVLRSTWDYYLRFAEFVAWVDRLESVNARLWNPPRMVRGNLDKRYLTELRHPHLAPPPSAFFVRGARIDLAALLEARGWTEAVIKPTVSADGFSTERTSRATAFDDQSLVEAMVERSDIVIQRLVPDIRTNGELSLMFFGGRFSHAVNKRPTHEEFRVQERLGGTIAPAIAPARLVRHATDLVATSAADSLYARIDVVVAEGRFVLMELELVEPSLFLAHSPAAPAAFADAVRRVATT